MRPCSVAWHSTAWLDLKNPCCLLSIVYCPSQELVYNASPLVCDLTCCRPLSPADADAALRCSIPSVSQVVCRQIGLLAMQQQLTVKRLLEPAVPDIAQQVAAAAKGDWTRRLPHPQPVPLPLVTVVACSK